MWGFLLQEEQQRQKKIELGMLTQQSPVSRGRNYGQFSARNIGGVRGAAGARAAQPLRALPAESCDDFRPSHGGSRGGNYGQFSARDFGGVRGAGGASLRRHCVPCQRSPVAIFGLSMVI